MNAAPTPWKPWTTVKSRYGGEETQIVDANNKRILTTSPEIAALILKCVNTHEEMAKALAKAVADYGKPGGPWNIPSEPGTWIEMARAAITKANEAEKP